MVEDQEEAEYEELTDHVKSSDMLGVEEKETVFGFTGRDDEAWVSSAHRGGMMNLLRNRYFELKSVSVERDGKIKEMDADQYKPSHGYICGVNGRLPVGSLSIKSTPRSTQTPSSVVNANYDHDDWDAEEVYGE